MNVGYVTAIAALAGSAIGALASFGSAWLTQSYQQRAQRAAAEHTRREKLFGDFIDEASRLFADAMAHGMNDPANLVPLYAAANRMRLFANPKTSLAADAVMELIIETYYAPNRDFATKQEIEAGLFNPLREFTEACRAELMK